MQKTRFKNGLRRFRQIFFSPRVVGFIVLGGATVFLTFLTDENAVELVISAISSIFIGIGVNNFTVIEDRLNSKDRERELLRHYLARLEKIRRRSLEIGKNEALTIQMLRSEMRHLSDQMEMLESFCRYEIGEIEAH